MAAQVFPHLSPRQPHKQTCHPLTYFKILLLILVLFFVGTVSTAAAPSEFRATQITVTGEYSCATDKANKAYCWGLNQYGQLGDGTTISRNRPTAVANLVLPMKTIMGAGSTLTCGVTVNGGAKCWGKNNYGQLGDGSKVNSLVPVDVLGLSTNTDIAIAGDFHSCALTLAGGVKCWGNNDDGQLGNDAQGDSAVPVEVKDLTSNVTALAVGESHNCALVQGSVKCWGYNYYCEVGDGTQINRRSPVTVPNLENVITIAAGENHTCAVQQNGTVKCWGLNRDGELGNGTKSRCEALPVEVKGLSEEVVSINGGRHHTCAVTKSGRVMCWGGNDHGQVGITPTITETLVPVEVTPLATDAVAVGAGYAHSCAVTKTGSVKCWGWNAAGQLGDGTTTDSYFPVEVGGEKKLYMPSVQTFASK